MANEVYIHISSQQMTYICLRSHWINPVTADIAKHHYPPDITEILLTVALNTITHKYTHVNIIVIIIQNIIN